ncbi:VWA domain-containing protein [Promethearchaeum syntrophicum]|uniref:VWA domain-containing protein n=1 Tax=Promethearchaeum syntrophicum TaxID=2594042 RepID=A0A5B9D755_9ARCH|nr:vWA domain-containing protein [Candidatus Prometheoarchaeum syntrophicum]QEE14637.1 von Willebrand factor type A domain protein [Candidatus Prometheoarchaeum syntrophicum]
MRFSNLTATDLLKYEILQKRVNKRKYSKLAKDIGFNEIKSMTGLSIREGNIEALMGMAQSNIYAVTAELQKSEYNQFFSQKFKNRQDSFIPFLYFMVRPHAPRSFKIMLQKLTRSIILRHSLNISGRGSYGKARHRIKFYPGIQEFDLDQTLFNYLQNGNKILRFSDIIGIERRQRKRSVVLILDTSGSMFGKLLLNAALTTSVLTYALSKDFTSIILFNSKSLVLKEIKTQNNTTRLIDQILETEAVGFTNISSGLKKGLKELNKIESVRKKVGILITDGDFNRGKDPAMIATKFPKLHVINIPPESQKITSKKTQSRGQLVCQKIARAGRGYYIPVKNFSDIPRTLMKLISKI